MSRGAVLIVGVASLSFALTPPLSAAPIEVGIDRPAIQEAVRIGLSQDQASRQAFHAAYCLPVDDQVIRQLEIVTEFRRVVQASEERAGLRDFTWDAARAAAELQPARGLVSLVLDLQFDPQNTYRSMPAYSVAIYARGRHSPVILPVDSRTTQSYIGSQPAPPGTPILAATVRASFDAAALDPDGQYLAAVLLDGREVRRIPFDLGSIR